MAHLFTAASVLSLSSIYCRTINCCTKLERSLLSFLFHSVKKVFRYVIKKFAHMPNFEFIASIIELSDHLRIKYEKSLSGKRNWTSFFLHFFYQLSFPKKENEFDRQPATFFFFLPYFTCYFYKNEKFWNEGFNHRIVISATQRK